MSEIGLAQANGRARLGWVLEVAPATVPACKRKRGSQEADMSTDADCLKGNKKNWERYIRVMLKKICLCLSLILALTGCGSTVSTSTDANSDSSATQEYLNNSSDLAMRQGKSDFDSLVLHKDDFTKEAYYYLPQNEKNKIALNKIQYEFYLYKPSDSDKFVPQIQISYGGDEWLFMESAIFKINDEVMDFAPIMDPVRQTITNGVFEVLFFELTNKQVNFLGKTKSITDLDIRVITETLEEMKLNAVEYKGLKKILSAYRYYLSTQK